MTKLEKAARQALEALCVAVEPKRGRYYCMDEQPVDMVVKYTEAITALREALAEQAEQEPVHSVGDNYEHFTSYMGAEHSALLCQAYFDGANAPHEEYEAYMEANPAKQHPSMDITIEPHGGRCIHSCDLSVGRWNLYAAPVRTKDLTDAEILKIVDSLIDARAVIAKLREKNS